MPSLWWSFGTVSVRWGLWNAPNGRDVLVGSLSLRMSLSLRALPLGVLTVLGLSEISPRTVIAVPPTSRVWNCHCS